MTPTNVEACLIDGDEESIFVAVNRVRPCYSGVPDTSWTGLKKRKSHRKKPRVDLNNDGVATRTTGPVTRSMATNRC